MHAVARTSWKLSHGLILPLLAGGLALAQAAPPPPPSPTFTPPPPTPNDTLRSVEVMPGGHVMFRIYAPQAQQVKVQAEGPESTPGMTMQDMMKSMAGTALAKQEDGVWSVDYGVIQPGVYRYNFVVDGVSTTDPKNPVASETLTTVKSLYEVPGAGFLEYKADVPHGAVATVFYNSPVTGGLRRMHIYTPPGYEAENSRKYPVFYLLHGGGDSDDSWPTVGRAGAILDNLIAAGKAVPMIVVMPAGHTTREFRLTPGSTHDMFHSNFVDDLVSVIVPYVEKNYRATPDRDHRAIAGLSMGGAHTLTAALNHSDLFAYVGVFSSGWFPEMLKEEETTDLAVYKRDGKPFRLFWQSVGKQDIAFRNSQSTADELTKAGITVDYHTTEGFHAWNNWRDNLHTFAPLLFQPR